MSSTYEAPTESGVLLASDEQSVIYLIQINDSLERNARFITHQLDARHLFVRPESMETVYVALQKRLHKIVWDEEGLAAAAVEKEKARKR